MIDQRPRQSPVRRQGDRPSCVAFAVTAVHEWMAGEDTQRSPEDALWAGHAVGGDPWREETSVALALEGLDAHHHATEQAWPYGTPPWPADRPAAASQAANQRALPTWRRMPDLGLTEIERELTAGFAVILTVGVVLAAWRRPGGGVDAPNGAKTPGNHAVVAVGVLDAPPRVVIKNSWGPGWGDAGYGYLSARYVEQYGLIGHVLEA